MVSTGFDNFAVDGIETWNFRSGENALTGWYTGIGFGYGDMIEDKPWILCEQLHDVTEAAAAARNQCFWNEWPDNSKNIGTAAVVPKSNYPTITVTGSTVTWQRETTVTTTRGEKEVELAVSPTWNFEFVVDDMNYSDLYESFCDLRGRKKESILGYGKVFGGNVRKYGAHPDYLDRSHSGTKWSGAVNTAIGAASLLAITAASFF